jgi:hypothetical protein
VLGVLAGIDAQGIAFSVLPLNILVTILASYLAAWIGWDGS